jgi:hypothetical protein
MIPKGTLQDKASSMGTNAKWRTRNISFILVADSSAMQMHHTFSAIIRTEMICIIQNQVLQEYP